MALAQKIQEKTQKALGAHPADAKISKSYFSISFIALLVGGVLGLLQGLNRAGLLELPTWLNYYQVLTRARTVSCTRIYIILRRRIFLRSTFP